ncbi:uncharacterized protein PADG_04217 [Paracoccidioides brasiliensis Pb18]|uniref:Uncharacterized protein n=2 Tax=Paracoccidioides brasiliensis TaxID=121759 RepID=C1GAD1_PARBD|nr:uncharacterized protein PADG_04217 [Paracoccidioides brasiliensis Pb18]EEH48133.2 hypothetical protein PADG_04217 [Paracoccidioides brasiliensis Pb18]ODH26459.1 hypothetical protein ACO22_04589 [Paracoccidioides brasiliensis]ODH48090.1 hypothetical protein GX48_05776 [Paracoccidioides brasiliensis]
MITAETMRSIQLSPRCQNGCLRLLCCNQRYPGMTGSFTVEVDDDERIFKVTESESLSPPRGDSGLV